MRTDPVILLDGQVLDVRNAAEARRRLGVTEPVPPDLSQYVLTTDGRLSNARTPTAHAASHEADGSDELDVTGLAGTLAEAQPVAVRVNGVAVGTRIAVDFIEDRDVRLSGADDAFNGEVAVTITGASRMSNYLHLR